MLTFAFLALAFAFALVAEAEKAVDERLSGWSLVDERLRGWSLVDERLSGWSLAALAREPMLCRDELCGRGRMRGRVVD